MEFKFRAIDHRPPNDDQPFRGGYAAADPRRNAEAIDHQQAAEMARRRALEAEVRMELMMEREMVMQRAAESRLPFEEIVAMRFDPRYPFIMPHPLAGWILEDHLFPLPSKDNLVFLTKPEPSLSGVKRKAETLAGVGASDPSSTVSMKKPKEEWSCALCQVSATSEKGLNEHLQGKKHKAREDGLRAERATKNPTGVKLPKKTGKLKPAEDTGSADPIPKEKLYKESFPLPADSKSSVHIIKVVEDKEGEVQLQKIEKAAPDIKRTRKFKQWCEICKVGAFCERVMENHKKGKKHVARLKEVGQKETVPASGTTPDSVEEGKDANTAKAANEKPVDDVIIAYANAQIVL